MAKPGFVLRQALKFRSRRWRRRQVVLASSFLMFFWLMTLGETHRGFSKGINLFNVLVFSLFFTSNWTRPGRFVTDPDDRAIYEFGRSWDELNEAEQESLRTNNLLRTYRSSWKSEWREMLRLKTVERSWTILQVTLVIVLIVYLTAWGLLPNRPDGLNPRDLIDPVAWFVGLVSFCIVLPGAVWMWVEPDWEPEVRTELQPVATS
ncbi:hypothetical protein FTW19_25180 [Terriglobus albidus]|uniref:Uncharacterized protein n=1 Tax=Terriglobus albidus TaxID=1592106 RepID=A0A5B9ELK4_9BACT|nr:hypothetical protein [Terriglobus albidus]QEE31006.1 hypothetical protein FTW19_25180 [Terriglobus albidus]